MAEDGDNTIGARLRASRTARGFTLHQLAGLCGLTRGYLSLVERGLKTPSIAALLRMTEALETDVGVLFDAPRDAVPDYVLYRHQDRVGPDAVPLAPGRGAKIMEPFIIRLAATAVHRATHSGEELIVVLCGEAMIRLGEETMVLRTGDSLYFSASIQHSIHRIGSLPAELLVVVARSGSQ